MQTWWPWRPPPLSKNHVKTWLGHETHQQKRYPRTAGVSARWFDATNNKKNTYIHLKNTPFVSMLADQLHVVQVELYYRMSLFHFTKLHRHVAEIVHHHATLGDCTHLLFWSRLKPEAGRDHGVVFFQVCAACCLLCCAARSDSW